MSEQPEKPGTFWYEVKAGWRRLTGLPTTWKVGIAAIAVVVMVIAVASVSSDDEPSRRSTVPRAPVQERPLESFIDVVSVDCLPDEASGRVKNSAARTVDVAIEAEFLDSAGVILDNGLDFVSGIRGGETAEFHALYLGDESYARCRANVGQVFEQ